MTTATNVLDLPHHEARSLLSATRAPVFVAMNPVEFHGPHLSLHNDRHVTAGLSRDLHARLSEGRSDYPFLVVDDLELGVEPASGPGSRRTSYADARRAIVETCRALVELGARRAVINTFHGGALHNLAIDEGVRVFERAGGRAVAPLAIALARMVDFDEADVADALDVVHATPAERAALRASVRFDFHAGWLETSLALHYAPRTVSPIHRELPPAPELGRDRALALAERVARTVGAGRISDELAFVSTAATWSRLRPFLGYTGMPHLASREAGARLADRFVDRYAEVARAVLDGGASAPRAPFAWMPWLTLNGRVDATHVPTDQVASRAPRDR